jgi:hypothetical protein
MLYAKPYMKIFLQDKIVDTKIFIYSLFEPREFTLTTTRLKANEKQYKKNLDEGITKLNEKIRTLNTAIK